MASGWPPAGGWSAMPGRGFPILAGGWPRLTAHITVSRSRRRRAAGAWRKSESLARLVRPRRMDALLKPRALIVDDEAPARLRIRQLLERTPSVAIAGEGASGSEAVGAIGDRKSTRR